MFDPVCFIDNPTTDTQAWMFWNPAERTVCVAFRGTEQTKWKVSGAVVGGGRGIQGHPLFASAGSMLLLCCELGS